MTCKMGKCPFFRVLLFLLTNQGIQKVKGRTDRLVKQDKITYPLMNNHFNNKKKKVKIIRLICI